MQVEIQTPLRPTEDRERVAAAVTAFFPDAVVEVREDEVVAEALGLVALRKRIWQQRIIDTFRSALLGGAVEDTVTVRLNKQAASQGKLSLPATPHPLGEVTLRMRVDEDDPWPDGESLAWWLCPETKDGEIVGPVE